MKFAITGHTAGIGQAVSRLTPFTGFSRSTGYDISNPVDRQRIIAESHDCSVFINNAHSGYHQTELLYELFEKWQQLDRLIINIGSNTTDGIKKIPHEYSAQKAALEKATEQLANTDANCNVSIIRFGWVGTERVLKAYSPESFITVADAASIIIAATQMKYRMVSMTVLPEKP